MTLRYSLNLLTVAVVVSGCGDVVERHYPTLLEARTDNLFEKGWLPDILPPSSRGIHVANDLDFNHSHGEFSFDPRDGKDFATRIIPHAVASALHGHVPANSTPSEGFSMASYSDDEGTWLFTCNFYQGYCEYSLRPTKISPKP